MLQYGYSETENTLSQSSGFMTAKLSSAESEHKVKHVSVAGKPCVWTPEADAFALLS